MSKGKTYILIININLLIWLKKQYPYSDYTSENQADRLSQIFLFG